MTTKLKLTSLIEYLKTTLQKSGEDMETTLKTSGEDVKTTLKTGGEDVIVIQGIWSYKVFTISTDKVQL